MELVEASATIPDKDQRPYIKIETLRGKYSTEIHRALSDPCKIHVYIYRNFSKFFFLVGAHQESAQ